ncbi:MAG TPA: pyrroline-5-carboxylate reductase dimerization domain-containing protein [Allosphingosinicella sp.]
MAQGLLSVPTPIWLVGCGNMAGAMLGGWLDAGADPGCFTAIRPSGRPVAPGVRVATAMPTGDPPAIALLAVKPQKLDEVAPVLAPALGPDTILVSILAGVELASLRARFPQQRHIARAMPNTPVRLRKGVTQLFTDSPDAKLIVEELMAALGLVEWHDDEALFALAGHLSGAGPAFLFRFIDALAGAGSRLGLAPDQSARIAAGMVEGAAALAAEAEETPRQLAERVASPGGTTRAGLNILDQEGALDGLILRTLDASRLRGIEMAAAARPS